MLAAFTFAMLVGVFMAMVVAFVIVAAATIAAGAAGKVFLRRDASELDSFRDGLLDDGLEVMHLFLGIQEADGDRVLEQIVAVLLKSADFGVIQSLATLLLFLQFLALVHDGFVLAARVIVGEESLDAFVDSRRLQLGEDGFAEFLGLRFNLCGHKYAHNKAHLESKINWEGKRLTFLIQTDKSSRILYATHPSSVD
jgi:hypothetical protein